MALSTTCLREDAQKVTKGQTAVNKDVVRIILRDDTYWSRLDQLILVTRPIVNMIGNLESHTCTLADCVIELLRCARTLAELSANNVDEDFLQHTRTVFQARCVKMITPLHALCLFLHPLCRNLALSAELTSGFDLEFMIRTALSILKRWHFRKDEKLAKQLKLDLQDYRMARGPFANGEPDALTWWRNLPIDTNMHSIKTLAIMLFSIVPHSAEVERVFSMLGGVQSPKHCNLSVETFEALSKCRAHYSRQQWERDRAAGKPVHRKHAHQHTRNTPGADVDAIKKLDEQWAVEVPFAARTDEDDVHEDEATVMLGIEKEFSKHAEQRAEEMKDVEVGEMEILMGKMFDLSLLDEFDRGEVVNPFNTSPELAGSEDEGGWDIDDIMAM